MSKFTVEEIEKRAKTTIEKVRGRRGDSVIKKPVALVRHWRFYCKQVLFLCKEIKKLRKRIK